jgi:hypothetical protein
LFFEVIACDKYVNFLITKTEVYFSIFCSFPAPNEKKKSL